jgi:hypothetical protein
MSIPQRLVDDVRAKRVILFVGAGLSMGLGLPSWSQLIQGIGEALDFDPSVFASLGDYLQLAEYYTLVRGPIGALRSRWDREWHGSGIAITNSAAHNLIVELAFPIIYTTNYDRWIEKAFESCDRPYFKISTARHLAEAPPSVTQIIKFHGDFDSDDSLVLTESDYFERLEFESPLDLRLRSDVIGRSVLFIGYSLADLNVRLLFYKLTKLWKDSGQEEVRPRSYLFFPAPNVVQRRVLMARGIEVLESDTDDPGQALAEFLAELRNRVLTS